MNAFSASAMEYVFRGQGHSGLPDGSGFHGLSRKLAERRLIRSMAEFEAIAERQCTRGDYDTFFEQAAASACSKKVATQASSTDPMAAQRRLVLALSTRCRHPLSQTGRNKAATKTPVDLQVHGNEAIDSAQI